MDGSVISGVYVKPGGRSNRVKWFHGIYGRGEAPRISLEAYLCTIHCRTMTKTPSTSHIAYISIMSLLGYLHKTVTIQLRRPQLNWSPSPSKAASPRLAKLRNLSLRSSFSASSLSCFLRSYTARTVERTCSFPSS